MRLEGPRFLQKSLDTGNPFIAHEIYKTTRKLAFPETNDRKCIISDVKESDDANVNMTDYNINLTDYRYVNTDYAPLYSIEKRL